MFKQKKMDQKVQKGAIEKAKIKQFQ